MKLGKFNLADSPITIEKLNDLIAHVSDVMSEPYIPRVIEYIEHAVQNQLDDDDSGPAND
jgi:hypothetical protein